MKTWIEQGLSARKDRVIHFRQMASDRYRDLFDGFICIAFSRLTASNASRGLKEDAWIVVKIIARSSASATLPFTFLYLNETL